MPGKPYQEPTVKVNNQKLTAVDKSTYLGSTLSLAVCTSATKPMPESLRQVWPPEDFVRQCADSEEGASQPS